MGVTASGMPYPEPGDSPDVPRDIKALAEKIPRILYYAAVACPANGWATVTFPADFFVGPNRPVVVATNLAVGTFGYVNIRNITLTGCEVSITKNGTDTIDGFVDLVAVK